MKKIRNILTLALSGLFLAGFLLAAILTPDRTDSLSERRKLAQRPTRSRCGTASARSRHFSPGISCGSSIITEYMQPAGISQSSTIR